MQARTLLAATLMLVAASIPLWRSPAEPALSVVVVVFAFTGVILRDNRPDNVIGWLFLWIAVLFSTAAAAGIPEWQGWATPTFTRVLFSSTFFPAVALVMVLVVLFPTGRPPTPRWRWVLWTALAFALLAVVGNGLPPGSKLGSRLGEVAAVPILIGTGAGVASAVVRYRRAKVVERAQLRWFLLASAFFLVMVVVGDSARDHPYLQLVFVALGLFAIPVAVTVAVLRYRLYEIDRLISRTLAYALITAVLVGVYVLVAVVPATMFDLESDLLAAAATLAAAAAFGPVRRRVQSAVDRRFNRSRYNALQTADAFRARLRHTVDLEDLSTDLVNTVGSTVQPSHATVWLRPTSP